MKHMTSCVICALMLAMSPLRAQTLPAEIRIIVPVTAGSTLDSRARVLAEALGKQIKRTVIVENRVGAGGTIGALAVSKSRPDGSTLLFINNSQVISPHIYPNAGYDPIKDFAPITQAYFSGMVLVAHRDIKVGTVKELVALARTQAQPISYASSGTGSLPHLGMEVLKQVAGIDLLHIPYRGDGQALADVLSGRVPLMMSGYIVAQPHIKSGKLRALAVTSRQRAAIFPSVPSIPGQAFSRPRARRRTWWKNSIANSPPPSTRLPCKASMRRRARTRFPPHRPYSPPTCGRSGKPTPG